MSIDEESFLETPSYVLALVLVGFQLAALLFTSTVAGIKNWLARRRRLGLRDAVAHMEQELMVVGFVSLCLIALQVQLSSICIDASPKRADWTMLQSVYSSDSCSCCLASTTSVQPCIGTYAHCGNATEPYGYCDAQYDAKKASTDSHSADGSYAAAPYGAAEGSTPYADSYSGRRLLAGSAAAVGGPTCVGATTVAGTCPEGKIPAVSFLALEQVHLLVFVVSLVHVMCSFMLYFVALARIRLQWARWEATEDQQALTVGASLESYYATIGATSRSATALPANGAPAGPQPPANGAGSVLGPAAAKAVPADKDDDPDVEQQEESGNANAGPPLAASGAKSFSYTLGRVKVKLQGMVDTMKAISHRPGDGGGRLGGVVEALKCGFIGFFPGVVTQDEYYMLRASFLCTNKLGPRFAFLDFVQRSLEEDLSHVVGLSFEFWVLIVLIVLMSGPFGFPTAIFMGGAGLVMMITNGKLAMIIRSVTERSAAGRLTSGVFWLNRPPLMLIPVKLCLFMCAFIYAWFLFAVWQFSPSSCPFTDAFYPDWVLPWWTILIFNSLILVHLSTHTLPTYSLAVQLGSDWKKHMLPRQLTQKLLAVAEATKKKFKEQQAAELAAAR